MFSFIHYNNSQIELNEILMNFDKCNRNQVALKTFTRSCIIIINGSERWVAILSTSVVADDRGVATLFRQLSPNTAEISD